MPSDWRNFALIIVIAAAVNGDCPPGKIELASHSGNACPQSLKLDPCSLYDGNYITAQFPSFILRRGNNVTQSEAEADCEFEYNIPASPNYRFYIASTSYRDDVDVAQGMTATHYMDYFSQDKPTVLLESSTSYSGGTKESISSTTVPTPQLYGTCGGLTKIFARSRGVVTETDDSKGDTSSNISKFNAGNTIIKLGWKSC